MDLEGDPGDALFVGAVQAVGDAEDGGEARDGGSGRAREVGEFAVGRTGEGFAVVAGDGGDNGEFFVGETGEAGVADESPGVLVVLFILDEDADVMEFGGEAEEELLAR